MTFLDELTTPALRLAPPAEATEKDCEYWRYPRTALTYANAVKAIEEVICGAYGVTPQRIIKHDRHLRLSWARHLVFYFVRTIVGDSLHEIGAAYHRDHGAVLHGVNVVKNLTSAYPRLAAAVQELQRQIEEKLAGR